MDKREQAYTDWENGLKYKEIAEKYDVSLSTVKSWAARYWKKSKVATNVRKKLQPQNKKLQPKKEKTQPIADEVSLVLENEDLTDEQRLFCLYYIKYFNATKAYQKAYGVSYNTAASIAYRTMEIDGVKNEIYRLKQAKLNKAMLEPEDIFQKYLDIAMADMNDYAEFGVEEVPVVTAEGPLLRIDEKTGKEIPVTQKVNYMRFKPSNEVDGTLLTEIKQGKTGSSIKLADRMKAMDWLSNHMGMANDEQKSLLKKARKILEGVDSGF